MHFDTLGTHWQDGFAIIGLIVLALSFALARIDTARRLACLAFGLIALYFATGDTPQWAALAVSLALAAINAAQLARTQRKKASTRLTAQEQALRSWLFPSMEEVAFHQLLKVADRTIAPAGTFLATQGEHLDQMHIIIQGAAHVVFNGMVVATLRDGSLVGEVSFFRDDVATASVVAQTDLNILSLGRTELRKLMDESDAVKQALHESIGRDLGFKLTSFDQSRF